MKNPRADDNDDADRGCPFEELVCLMFRGFVEPGPGLLRWMDDMERGGFGSHNEREQVFELT